MGNSVGLSRPPHTCSPLTSQGREKDAPLYEMGVGWGEGCVVAKSALSLAYLRPRGTTPTLATG